MLRRLFFVLLALPIMAVASPAAAIVVLNDFAASYAFTRADDAQVEPLGISDQVDPPGIPFLGTTDAIDGAARSRSTITFTQDALDFDFIHEVSAADDVSAQSVGTIYLRVTQPTSYLFTGSYAMADPEGRAALYNVRFIEHAVGNLLHSAQSNQSTPNQTFVMGGAAGVNNTVEGATFGTLQPGVDYRIFYNIFIQSGPIHLNDPSNTAPATATGGFTVSFGVVPEPGTATLLGVGLLLLPRRRTTA